MKQELFEHIISSANKEQISVLFVEPEDPMMVAEFVKDMVFEALMDSSIRELYENDVDEDPSI